MIMSVVGGLGAGGSKRGLVVGGRSVVGGGGGGRGGTVNGGGGWLVGDVGGGAGGAGGSSKSVGGTPASASFMKDCHVAAGMDPPVTRLTPLMLNSDVGTSLFPIHTAVDSVGV